MTEYSPYIYNQLQIVIFDVFLAIYSRLQIVILTFFGYLQSTANSHFNVFDYLQSTANSHSVINFEKNIIFCCIVQKNALGKIFKRILYLFINFFIQGKRIYMVMKKKKKEKKKKTRKKKHKYIRTKKR